MSPFRLVIVTRRYWPLVGSAQRAAANLAGELAASGWRVTVLTAAWGKNWPAEITLGGVPVVRLPYPPRSGWETCRYVRLLARWLRSNQDRYDLVYVSMLKHEAYAALGAVGCRMPVVLRAERAGRGGDCLWQLGTRRGRRIKRRCMKAAAIVGPTRAIERELRTAGYPEARVHYLPNGVPLPPPRSLQTKAAARAVLADANSALETHPGTPLAVYVGRLQQDRELDRLVAAWEPIARRWPDARLWLVGQGLLKGALKRQIEALNLADRVLAVGVFDHVDELLAAADLAVLPSAGAATSLSLLEAMAAGLPVVAGDGPGNRPFVTDGREGLLVPAADTAALSGAIARLLDRPDLARRLGAAARERAAAEFSLAEAVRKHVTLFQGLIHSGLLHSNAGTVGRWPVAQQQP